MPTASTAQILGNNESVEPYTSNIYTRRVLSGEFQVRAVRRALEGGRGPWAQSCGEGPGVAKRIKDTAIT